MRELVMNCRSVEEQWRNEMVGVAGYRTLTLRVEAVMDITRRE